METLWTLMVLAVASVPMMLLGLAVATVWSLMVGLVSYALTTVAEHIKFCVNHPTGTTRVNTFISLVLPTVVLILIADLIRGLA